MKALARRMISQPSEPGESRFDTSRLSTCSIALNDRSADRAFAAIADAGYTKVEVHEKVHFSLFPDECDHVALKETAQRHGLQISGLATYVGGGLDGREIAFGYHDWVVDNAQRFTSVGFASNQPAELEEEFRQLKQAINLAAFFGARTVRVVPGDDRPENIETLVPWFKRSADYAAEKKIVLCVENHGDRIAGTPDLCLELSEKVDSPYFGILYEPGNLMNDTGTDYKRALLTMKDHIRHIHVKDCKRVGDGYELQQFGEGTIDFPWIVEQLDAAGYDGDIATEFELHDMRPDEGIKRFYDDFVRLFQS
jgi:sugar phosphate isomerase/epimerase